MGELNNNDFLIKEDGTIVRKIKDEQGKILDRYELAFLFVPLLVDTYNEYLQRGESIQVKEDMFYDKSFWKRIMQSMGVSRTNFNWDDISFSHFHTGKKKIIVITFPQPLEITHAKYGLIVIDKKAKYFTLEKTMSFNSTSNSTQAWVVGSMSNKQHVNYGSYEGEVSEESFVKEVLRRCYQIETGKEPEKKGGCIKSTIGILLFLLFPIVLGCVIGFIIDEPDSPEMGALFGAFFSGFLLLCWVAGIINEKIRGK